GVRAPPERRLRLGRSEGDGHAADPGGLCGISAAFARGKLARGARGVALRVQFRGGALQLYVREFVPDEVSSLLLTEMDGAFQSDTASNALRVRVRTAPLELRERVVFTPEQALDAADELRRKGILEEAVVLSTCNRSEFYGVPA